MQATLPRSTPSADVFNRLARPFTEQAPMQTWVWDAELPPSARSTDAGCVDAPVSLKTTQTKPGLPGRCMSFGLSGGADTSPTYEPFADPMSGWAWGPPDTKTEEPSGPALFGPRQPSVDQWKTKVADEPTESWQSFSQQYAMKQEADFGGSTFHETPPDQRLARAQNIPFNIADRLGRGADVNEDQRNAYDSDNSEVWSAGSGSDDERGQRGKTSPHQPSQPQVKKEQLGVGKRARTASARASKPARKAVTQEPNLDEPQEQCPFCAANDNAADNADDGRKTRKRRRKAVSRTTQRHGRWWQTLGYAGPSYCQRCSEVFRDHIIRQKPNSAGCNRNNPCDECAKVLVHFCGGNTDHKELWHRIDARGYAKSKQGS